jgi:hypothetical protein
MSAIIIDRNRQPPRFRSITTKTDIKKNETENSAGFLCTAVLTLERRPRAEPDAHPVRADGLDDRVCDL